MTGDDTFESMEGTFDEKLCEISCSVEPLYHSVTFQRNIYILWYFTTKADISESIIKLKPLMIDLTFLCPPGGLAASVLSVNL